MRTGLVWFGNDLKVTDQEALKEAFKNLWLKD